MSVKYFYIILGLVMAVSMVGLSAPETGHALTRTEICGDANCNGTVGAILDITYSISHLYHNGPDFCNDYNADVNSDGAVNILDIVVLINYTYHGGPLECRTIDDDFPAAVGSWWQYRRWSEDEATYDTILIAVVAPDTMTCTYPDRTATVTLDYPTPDIVDITGIDPLSRYEFLFEPGNIWFYPESPYYDHSDTVMTTETITVPAGTFENVWRIHRHTYWLEKNGGRQATIKYGPEWYRCGVGMIKRIKNFYEQGHLATYEWELLDYHLE